MFNWKRTEGGAIWERATKGRSKSRRKERRRGKRVISAVEAERDPGTTSFFGAQGATQGERSKREGLSPKPRRKEGGAEKRNNTNNGGGKRREKKNKEYVAAGGERGRKRGTYLLGQGQTSHTDQGGARTSFTGKHQEKKRARVQINTGISGKKEGRWAGRRRV